MFRVASNRIARASSFSTQRSLASKKFVVPDLPYDYNALEPVISSEIMKLHHDKHHEAYVANLNKAIEDVEDALSKQDMTKLCKLQKLINFNGGGHINHSIFWKNLAPINKGGGQMPDGCQLKTMIESQYGSREKLESIMATVCNQIQGSGWGWLGYDKVGHRLAVAHTKNQTPLESKTGLVPLLGIDVWEHAFYPQYKNARAEYIKSIWSVIDWSDVNNNLISACKEEVDK